MPTISLDLSDDTATGLAELARLCTDVDKARKGASTHGPLDVAGLLTMLAEDAAMVVSRPGSWEGNSMAQLLSSHGYEF